MASLQSRLSLTASFLKDPHDGMAFPLPPAELERISVVAIFLTCIPTLVFISELLSPFCR